MKIAFLGTGLMGAPMARNLLSACRTVTVWNRNPAKAQPLAGLGAKISASANEAVDAADVVISMLTDGPAVDSVLSGVIQAGSVRSGMLWIDMSSTRPDEARAQANRLERIGAAHLDAPVSGGVPGAEKGRLAIMVGGRAEAFDRAAPVFTPMGHATWVGPTGSGQLAKLANQGIVAATIGAVAEAMLLLEAGGADPAAVRAALKGGFADSTILQMHGRRMSDRDFEPGGRNRMQLKDLVNITDEARSLGLALPMIEEVHKRYHRLVGDLGAGELDHASLFLELLGRNGIEGGLT